MYDSYEEYCTLKTTSTQELIQCFPWRMSRLHLKGYCLSVKVLLAKYCCFPTRKPNGQTWPSGSDEKYGRSNTGIYSKLQPSRVKYPGITITSLDVIRIIPGSSLQCWCFNKFNVFINAKNCLKAETMKQFYWNGSTR